MRSSSPGLLRKFIYGPVVVASMQNHYGRKSACAVVFRGASEQDHRELVTTAAELPATGDLVGGRSGAGEEVFEGISCDFFFGVAGEQNHAAFDVVSLPGLEKMVGG